MPRLAVCALVALAVACSAAPPEVDITKGQVRADMREYSMGLTANEVRAGTVTFVARDVGTVQHELVVIRTDLAVDKLAIDAQKQTASEQGKVDGVGPIDPGKTMNLRVELPPGHYVVICNVPTHYQLGMRAELTVR